MKCRATDNQSDEADDPFDVACERQMRLSIHYNRERNQNLRRIKKSRVKMVFYTANIAIPNSGCLKEDIHHIIPI